MGKIKFASINNIVEAQAVWEQLSAHKEIDDEWDFRFTFFKYLPYKLNFITGYQNGNLIGLLPLQENNMVGLMPPQYKAERPFLEFFGGDDTDSNTIFLKSDYQKQIYEEQFFQQINPPALLAPLAKPYMFQQKGAKLYEYKYMLSLQGLKNYEDYIEQYWEGSSRRKLRQQIRKLYKDYTINIEEDAYEDIQLLFNLNNKRFLKASSFRFLYRKRIFLDLIKLYKVKVITIVVNGKKEGVSYGILYKDKYIGMNSGVNNDISDIGKLLVLLQIEKAIQAGVSYYDAGKGNTGGWKEAFKFSKIPQYKLELA